MVSRRTFLSGAGSATGVLLAGCLSDSDSAISPGTNAETNWPQPRADSINTAYVADAKAPRESVRERWTVAMETASGTPAIVDGTVYLPTAAALVALDAATGTEQWRFVPTESEWFSSPIVHDGLVYCPTVRKEMYALDATTGSTRWSRTDHDYTALSLIAGDSVSEPYLVAGTDSGALFRLDPQTGKQTWQRDLFGTISAFSFKPPYLYVGTVGGEVYAFNTTEDGDTPPGEGWRRKIGSAVRTLLPCSEGLAVHTFGGPLRLVQSGAHAGTTRWTVSSKWANAAPIHANYIFYTAGYKGLTAVRDYDTKKKWRVDGRYDATGPVAAGDTMYVSNGSAVHAFAMDGGSGIGSIRTGAKRWSHPTPAKAVEGLAVADGALFAACVGRDNDPTTLYCLEPA